MYPGLQAAVRPNQPAIVMAQSGTNWFKPNMDALRDMIESSGFVVEHLDKTPDWGYARARKAEREFEVGLEGYNPGAALVRQGV